MAGAAALIARVDPGSILDRGIAATLVSASKLAAAAIDPLARRRTEA
jgi:hypothetical protein